MGFRLRGYNPMGVGLWSPYSSILDGHGVIVGAPRTVGGFGIHSNQVGGGIKLEWTKLSTTLDFGGDSSANMNYEIFGDKIDGYQNQLLATVSHSGANAEYRHDGTHGTYPTAANDIWFYRIRASNSGSFPGDFDYVLRVIIGTTPDPPQSLTVSAVTGSTMTLSWLHPASDGGSSIMSYELQVNGGTVISVANTALTIDNTDGAPGTAPTYVLRAVNALGASTDTSVSGVTVLA